MASALLSPAEAALLIDPRSASGATCVQLALLDLVARGCVRIELGGRWVGNHKLHLTGVGAEPLPAHLVALLAALGRGREPRILTRNQVVQALQRHFGSAYGRYVRQCLAPILADRGLLVEERRRLIGLFAYTRYRRTEAGEESADSLRKLVAALESMPKLIASDPEQALQLARSAGVLLALSPKARRQAGKLKALLEDRNSDATVTAAYAPGQAGGEHGLETGGSATFEGIGHWFDSVGAIGDFTPDSGGSDAADSGGGGGD